MPVEQNSWIFFIIKNCVIVCRLSGATEKLILWLNSTGEDPVQFLANAINIHASEFQNIIHLDFSSIINFLVNYTIYPDISTCFLKDFNKRVRIKKNENAFY